VLRIIIYVRSRIGLKTKICKSIVALSTRPINYTIASTKSWIIARIPTLGLISIVI